MKESDISDPVVEAYMQHVNCALLRENLKLTPALRLEKFARFADYAADLREAGRRARTVSRSRSRGKGRAPNSTNSCPCWFGGEPSLFWWAD